MFKRRLFRAYESSGLARYRARALGRGRPTAVFIWIPKTAGSSLQKTLGMPLMASRRAVRHRFPGNGIVTFGHQDYAELVSSAAVDAAFDRVAFKFCFVRNPYDRAVSLFCYLQRIGLVSPAASFLEVCRRLVRDGVEPIGTFNARGWSQFNPQQKWMERLSLDFVGRFESLDADLDRLFRALGLPGRALPKLNQSSRRPYAHYFCAESKALIEHFYAEDFQQLEYEHESF